MDLRDKLVLCIFLFLTVLSIAKFTSFHLDKGVKTTTVPAMEDGLRALYTYNLFSQFDTFTERNTNKHLLEFYGWLLNSDLVTDEYKQYIKYKRATILILEKHYPEGVALLKEIAELNTNSNKLRAMAIEHLARSFHRTRDLELTASVFSTEPYRSFLRGRNVSEATDMIFEYAATFYPLPVTELRIAKSYADEMLHISRKKKRSETDVEAMVEYKRLVDIKLESARRELAVHDYTEDSSAITQRYAAVYGSLFLAGDTTYGDPEKYYLQAIKNSKNDNQRGFALFHYAVYLAQLDENGRKEDIIRLLQNFYTMDTYEGTDIFAFFENIRFDAKVTNRGTLRLAQIDPQFKEFLKTRFEWTFD